MVNFSSDFKLGHFLPLYQKNREKPNEKVSFGHDVEDGIKRQNITLNYKTYRLYLFLTIESLDFKLVHKFSHYSKFNRENNKGKVRSRKFTSFL